MRTRPLHRPAAILAAAALLAGAVSISGAASAADYPVLRGSQIDDAPPPPSDFGSGTPKWSGFYFGGTAGLLSSQFDPLEQSEFLSRTAFSNQTTSEQGSPLLRFGKVSTNRNGFGGFAGYNFAFGDVVLGVEAEYFKADLSTDQRASISRLYTGIFPMTVPETASTSPLNTQTTVNVSGHTTTKLEDFGMVKARAGYALGNFMPFINIGAAVGRISTNANVSQNYSTVENFNRYNVVTNADGSVNRTTFAGASSMRRADGAGSGSASIVTSGYVPGLVLGLGLEALLGDNILVRAEYNRVYFTEYKGVNVVLDTARVGAGLKF